MRLRNALQPSRDGKRGLGFEGKPAPARNCGQIATPNRAGSEFGPIQELKLSIVFMKKANGNVRAMHVRAARRNGLSVEEIKEVLLQTAIYCGVPDANTAFRVAQAVLAEVETTPEEDDR
ncbi:MAG TPA: carboxymuconolactone decarboxylase family protein [Propionibacteriaceae bacterium]|jgi:hypothetical protein|nr:carboxymuconolactone decarboxylase family protein [Propionibacteriaceae bacterium]